MKKSILPILLLITSLVGCASKHHDEPVTPSEDIPVTPSDDVIPSDDRTPDQKYETKELNIYHEKDAVYKKISLRFYEEIEGVPYISVSHYFKEFFNTNLVVSLEGHIHSYSKSASGTSYLKFNAEEDTFSSNGLYSFSSHPDFKETVATLSKILRCSIA